MKVIIEDADLKDIHDTVRDWYRLDLANEQILELIKEDDNFLGQYVYYGLDTCVREYLGDILARKLTGRSWPEYRESEAVCGQFYEKFKTTAKAIGYKVLQDN